ncbi:glycoside hydrolase [Podospora conica]|nr:glycoside hydrolase [Schizothecium conicum]
MRPFLCTYPPLDQVTQLKDPHVIFTAVIELPVGADAASAQYEVALWHTSGEEEWAETTMTREKEVLAHGKLRIYFTTTIKILQSMSFTAKLRDSPSASWIWAKDYQGSQDGLVIIDGSPTRDDDPAGLKDLVHGLNPSLQCAEVMSECPRTRVWDVKTTVAGVPDEPEDLPSAYANVRLGIPWGGQGRWFALVRHWTPWISPRQGHSPFNPAEDAVLCSFLSPKGKHLVLLGVSNDTVTVLRGSETGEVGIHVRNDNLEDTVAHVVAAVGDTFESACAAAMYRARRIVEKGSPAPNPTPNQSSRSKEDWFDGLGYCTWNALGQDLTHEKITSTLNGLSANGINITSLIIDDGWQDVDSRGPSQWQHGWKAFEAKPEAFPSGLKGLVSEIRSSHKSIQHIAVWHSLLGYWAGLTPSGPLANQYPTTLVSREPTTPDQMPLDNTMTVIHPSAAPQFYTDFYTFLTSSGITGVKTDSQYLLDALLTASSRRALTTPTLSSWSTAAAAAFPSHPPISCMSQSPRLLFHPTPLPTTVLRNSDDYFPSVPASHPWHVFSNAHNALLTLHLPGVLPDWDMFQSAHAHGAYHAAARCVSGGPVYVTDAPGAHDMRLLGRVTAATPRGRTVVLRAGVVGRSVGVYTGYGSLSFCKVGAYHGRGGTGASVLGVFNVSTRAVVEVVPLGRFMGVGEGGRYVVRAFSTGEVYGPWRGGEGGAMVVQGLGEAGWEILTAVPVFGVVSERFGGVEVAGLGLVDKMMGCAAMMEAPGYEVVGKRVVVGVRLKALGVLGVYVSSLPEMTIEGNVMVTIQGQIVPVHTVRVDEADGHVLAVDVEAAWKEMGLEPVRWTDEVTVVVSICNL